MKNLSSPLTAWNVEFKLPNDHQLVNLWNAEVQSTDKKILVNNFNYNANVAQNAELNFGMQVSGETAHKIFEGEAVKLNGKDCTKIKVK